jgi:hypothetical protein
MMLIQQFFPLLTIAVAADQPTGNKVARWPATMVAGGIDVTDRKNLQGRVA